MLFKLYELLLERFGPQGWWPVKSGMDPEWEVMVGAVLTQNTSWRNVEKALENLSGAGLRTREDFLNISEKGLANLIRPSGYFNQKARKLREMAAFRGEMSRENLLSVWGIGPETADSILLYAREKAYFVIDAYTRRIFSRLGLADENAGYEELRAYFEDRLPRDPRIYSEFHALIVRLAKEFCSREPKCPGCPLMRFCEYEQTD